MPLQNETGIVPNFLSLTLSFYYLLMVYNKRNRRLVDHGYGAAVDKKQEIRTLQR